MNSFLGYYGEMFIPEERRQEFSERVLEIMKQCGMMEMDDVEIFDSYITLISPPSLDQKDRTCPIYSYFDETYEHGAQYIHDGCVLDIEDAEGNHYGKAVYTLLLFYEFYAKSFGVAHINGNVIDSKEHIGWLNYLFDEEYTNSRVEDICSIHMLLPESIAEEQNLVTLTHNMPTSFAATNALRYLCLYKTDSFLSFLEHNYEKVCECNNIAYLITVLGNLLSDIKGLDKYEEDEKIDILLRILKAEGDEKYEVACHRAFFGVAAMSLVLPFDIILKFISLIFKRDYDKMFEEVLPHIHCQPIFPFADTACKPEPVQKVSTAAFLGDISNDDRAYCWSKDGDVHFSDKMKAWFDELKAEYDKKLSSIETPIPVSSLMEMMLSALSTINERFVFVFAFKSMFYDFFRHADTREVQAAVKLMLQLIKDYQHELPEHDASASYDEIYLVIKDAPGRIKMKRFLAVMGNEELRQSIFGF